MRKLVWLVVLNLALFGLMQAGVSRVAAFDRDCTAVESKIDAWRSTSRERAVRDIGWAPDLDTAFALARASRRPVFVVTGDGDLCSGRV